jgi:hypothetical protein
MNQLAFVFEEQQPKKEDKKAKLEMILERLREENLFTGDRVDRLKEIIEGNKK